MTTVTWQELTEITLADLHNDLHAEHESMSRRPGEFTVKEWAAKYYGTDKHGMKTAYDELQSFVPHKMTKRVGKDNGHLCTFYKRANPAQDNSTMVK
jgi:hypothetical protein